MRVDLKEDLKWDLNQAEEIPQEVEAILQIPEIQEDRSRREEEWEDAPMRLPSEEERESFSMLSAGLFPYFSP